MDDIGREDRLYIAGEWMPAHGPTIPVENPATEAVIGEFVGADSDDTDKAVAAAKNALAEWSNTPSAARADLIDLIAAALETQADRFAELIQLELGAPAPIARALHVDVPISVTRQTASALRDFEFIRTIGHSSVYLQPTGVLAAITPWNLPLHQVIAKVIPAIAAGATVVLKPSSLTPLAAFELMRVMAECGLPPGVMNLVAGSSDVGENLVRHPSVRHVSFTGSTATGSRVGALASADVKRVTLELGGKSASVVLDDADEATLTKAVKITVANCFLNTGQTCTALSRLIVPKSLAKKAEEIAEESASKYTPGGRMGPLASRSQRDQVRGFLETEPTGGAIDLAPDLPLPDQGYFVSPHVLADVDPSARVAREEVFGPVLSIIVAEDEMESIKLANATDYGLAGAVWSNSTAHAVEVARHIDAGQIDINGAAFNPAAPFGGFKSSGVGREIGPYGIADVLEPKSIQVDPHAA